MDISIINAASGELNYTSALPINQNTKELLEGATSASENGLCAVIGTGDGTTTNPVTEALVVAVNGVLLWADLDNEREEEE